MGTGDFPPGAHDQLSAIRASARLGSLTTIHFPVAVLHWHYTPTGKCESNAGQAATHV
jgi:hypothetical protein